MTTLIFDLMFSPRYGGVFSQVSSRYVTTLLAASTWDRLVLRKLAAAFLNPVLAVPASWVQAEPIPSRKADRTDAEFSAGSIRPRCDFASLDRWGGGACTAGFRVDSR